MTNEELVTQYRNSHDSAVIEKLYLNNRGIIFKVANKYSGYMEVEDLSQEAFFVLLEAVRDWDSERDKEFLNYFAKMLHWKFRRLCKQNSFIRLPEYRMNNVIVLLRCREAMNKSEIILKQKWTEDIYTQAVYDLKLLQLERIDAEDENGTPLLDKLHCDEKGTERIEEDIDLKAKNRSINEAVENLPKELPQIIKLRYWNNKSFREIGEVTGQSMGEARRKHRIALQKLRLTRAIIQIAKDEYIYSSGVHGTGVRNFTESGMSSTERTAIKLYEDAMLKKKRGDIS